MKPLSGNVKSGEAFIKFEEWLEKHNFSELIIDIYRHNYECRATRPIMKNYFNVREGILKKPRESAIGYRKFKNDLELKLEFVDVIPTDEHCSYFITKQATLEKFGRYLEKRFGKKISIRYTKIKLNYEKVFGKIFHSRESLFFPKTNPKIEDFMGLFNPPAIIKFSAETLNNRKVVKIEEIRRCAIMLGTQNRLIDEINVFDRYAHEFGHNIGLNHQFIDPKNPPKGGWSKNFIEKYGGKFVGVDDIMIKNIVPKNKKMGRYVSPLSRYAIEPVQGYKDDKKFGLDYNKLYPEDLLSEIRDSAKKMRLETH